MVLIARRRAAPPSASAALVTKAVDAFRGCAPDNATDATTRTLIPSADRAAVDVMATPRREGLQRAGAAPGGGSTGPRLSRSSPVSLSIRRTSAVSPPARAGAAVTSTFVPY